MSGLGKILGMFADGIDVSSYIPNGNFNITTILNFVYGVAGVTAVGFIIVAGVQFLTSQGNPEKTAKAIRTIIYALSGLAVVILAALITNLITGTLSA